VRRDARLRTTWRLRLAVGTVLLLVLWATSARTSRAIGNSLVCTPDLGASEAILVENFDPNYLLFERARDIRRAGSAARVLVPIWTDRGTTTPNDVSLGIAEVMARIAGLGDFESVPVREVEPITLNAAADVLEYLRRAHIRSVTVITPLFRSRRSALVNRATLERAGIAVRCQPVQGSRGVDTWTNSWHGVQEVGEQWLKLQYYKFFVVPFQSGG
jgi:hypothetical protein